MRTCVRRRRTASGQHSAVPVVSKVAEAAAMAEAPPCAVTVTRLVDAPSNAFDAGLRERLAKATCICEGAEIAAKKIEQMQAVDVNKKGGAS